MNIERVIEGIRQPDQSVQYLRWMLWKQLRHKLYDTNGMHILDADWDTLIILDTARYDYFEDVCEIGGEMSKVRSLAPKTSMFLTSNFEGRRAHDTVYLSANAQVGKYRDAIDVHKVVGQWKSDGSKGGGQISERSITQPEPVVDKAIELHDKYPHKRHIVHLLPPHVPHLIKDGKTLPPDSPYRTYEAVRKGEVDGETMRAVYRENLSYVLDAIDPLLQYVDGKVVVTSDHGELLGEGLPWWVKLIHPRWGITEGEKFDWGHYEYVNAPELRDVPWLELPFDSRRKTTSDPPVADDIDETSIEEQLESLGYI